MADEKSNSDNFEAEIIKATAKAAFELAWETVGKIGNWAKQKSEVKTATQSYAEAYRKRYGNVKVLGMSKPMPLHQIYTAVRVVLPDFLHAFADPDEMEKRFRDGRRHDQGEPLDGIDIANETQFLNILGAPGSGKSTFLRRLGQESLLVHSGEQADNQLSTKYCHARLPVLIELREFRDGEFDLITRITDEFSVCGFPDSRDFVKTALASGKLLVLLDGLDEVANEDLEKVVPVVRNFIDQYSQGDDGNRFVTSCRTAQYKNYFKKFHDVVLAEFCDEQIEKFAQCWFSSLKAIQHGVAEEFVKQLHKPGHAGALELARTPLLLTFLCLTFEKGQELPPNPAQLYERALDILLREWAADKFVHNDPVAEGLHYRLELDMLACIAAELFEENRFFFTRSEAVAGIERFLKNELNAPRTVDPEAIFESIERQQGLIVQRTQNAYSFSHLTIQEYLTARNYSVAAAWGELVEKRLGDPRWLVVFELLAGLENADQLLRSMSERAVAILGTVAGLPGLLESGRQTLGTQTAAAYSGRPDRMVWASLDAMRLIAVGGAALTDGSDLPVHTNYVECAQYGREEGLDEAVMTHLSVEMAPRGRDREGGAWGRAMVAWRTIYRCKEAAYSLSPGAWGDVCNAVLSLPGSAS